MSDEPSREDVIVDTALELPPEQRKAYLDKACGGDPRLRELAEGLLRAHGSFDSSRKSLGSLGEAAISHPVVTAKPDESGLVARKSDQGGLPIPPLAPSQPRDNAILAETERIGRYKLLE